MNYFLQKGITGILQISEIGMSMVEVRETICKLLLRGLGGD